MPLDIHTEQVAGSLVVRPVGGLDLTTAPALSTILLSLPRTRPEAVVLDLSGVTFIDSSGLGVIVAAYRHSVQNGHGFSVAALTPMIARRFEITSLDNLIPIHLTAENG